MKTWQGITVVTILGLITGLALGGCTKAVSTSASTSAATSTFAPARTSTVPYGRLRIALASLGGQKLDPVIAAGERGILGPIIFDCLIRTASDTTPGVAERWELTPDGLSWIYYIRKGIKFSNGQDLTAKDVAFSLGRYISKSAAYSYLRDMVDRVEAVDDYTVRLYTKGPQPYLPFQTSMVTKTTDGLVMPKDYVEQNGAEYFNQHPIGSGPFKFVRQVPGDMVEYEAVDKHWRQIPEFKELSVIQAPETTTRVAMLRTGGVDAIDVGLEFASEMKSAGLTLISMEPQQLLVILHGAYDPRAARTPIADIKVRKALSLAINRDEIMKAFFVGQAVPSGPPFFTSNSSGDIDMGYWTSYLAKINGYDPAEAERLLKEAGYASGFDINFWSYARIGAPYTPKVVEIVAGYWSKIGVRVNIVPTDQGTYTPLRNTLNQPALLGQASISSYSFNPTVPKNLSAGFESTGSFGLLGKAFPEVDTTITAVYTEMDANKRKEIVAKVIKTGTDSYTSLVISDVPALSALGPLVDMNMPKGAFSMSAYLEFAKHKDKR